MEKDQLNSINELSEMLKDFNDIIAKRVCLDEYCYLYCVSLLESRGENLILRNYLLAN